eukprot:11160541-Lingulodinium_polyedra.AAC.1
MLRTQARLKRQRAWRCIIAPIPSLQDRTTTYPLSQAAFAIMHGEVTQRTSASNNGMTPRITRTPLRTDARTGTRAL